MVVRNTLIHKPHLLCLESATSEELLSYQNSHTN